MREKRSSKDRRSGVNQMLFFDRRSGKDRRSNNNLAKRSLKLKGSDTERRNELNYQIKPNLRSSRIL